jgi:hypothetical protein
MKALRTYRDDAGAVYDVPEDEAAAFEAEMPQARPAVTLRDRAGALYDVPRDELDAFKAQIPDAEPVRSVRTADGSTFDVPQSEAAGFLKEYRKDPQFEADRAEARAKADEAAPPVESVGRAALKGAARGAYIGANDAATQTVAGVTAIPVMTSKAAAYLAGGDTTAAGRFFGRSAIAGEQAFEPLDRRPEEVQGTLASLPGTAARSLFTNLVPAALTGGASTLVSVSPVIYAGSRGFDAYKAAKEAGKGEAEAQRIGALAAAVEGVPEGVSAMVGGGTLLREAVKSGNRAARLAKGIGKAMAPVAVEAGTEFVQEGGGALVDDVAAGRELDARKALVAGTLRAKA